MCGRKFACRASASTSACIGHALVPVGTFDGPCSACCRHNWSACTHKMSTLVHVCVSHWSNLFPTSGRLSDQIRPGHSVCVGHLGWVHVVATGRVYSICGQSRLSLVSFFVRSCACARHASALLCVCKTRELGSLAAEDQLEEREELKEAMAHRRATHSGIKEALAHRRATHCGMIYSFFLVEEVSVANVDLHARKSGR